MSTSLATVDSVTKALHFMMLIHFAFMRTFKTSYNFSRLSSLEDRNGLPALPEPAAAPVQVPDTTPSRLLIQLPFLYRDQALSPRGLQGSQVRISASSKILRKRFAILNDTSTLWNSLALMYLHPSLVFRKNGIHIDLSTYLHAHSRTLLRLIAGIHNGYT